MPCILICLIKLLNLCCKVHAWLTVCDHSSPFLSSIHVSIVHYVPYVINNCKCFSLSIQTKPCTHYIIPYFADFCTSHCCKVMFTHIQTIIHTSTHPVLVYIIAVVCTWRSKQVLYLYLSTFTNTCNCLYVVWRTKLINVYSWYWKSRFCL